MREIQLRDAFKLARLIKATNASDKIAGILEEVNEKKREARKNLLNTKSEEHAANADDGTEKVVELKANAVELKAIQDEFGQQFGVRIVMMLINAAAENNVEKMVYELLGDICELDADEMSKQSLKSVKEKIKEICRMNDIVDFFKEAGELAQDM